MKKQKKKGTLFWKVYAVALALFTVAVAILLFWGYQVMMDYDEAQGTLARESGKIAEKMTREIRDGTYESFFADPGNAEAPLLFEREAYTALLQQELAEAGGVLTARKGFSTDRYTKPVYDIMAGDKRVASVQFKKSEEESRYGFDRFVLEKVVPVTNGRYSVSVLVPENATLYLNDVPVDGRWKDGEPVSFPALPNALTLSGSGSGSGSGDTQQEPGNTVCLRYTVSGLMETPVPKIVYPEDGSEAELIYDEENRAWRCRDYEIIITAPSNFSVQVNGVPVSGNARFVQEDDIKIKEIAISQQYTKGRISLVKYSVGGLRSLADVRITATAFDGTAAKVVYDESTGVYAVSYGDWDEKTLEHYQVGRDFLITRAREYAKFVTNDGNVWDDVLPYVLEGSELYDTFANFWITYSVHNQYWTENETLAELCPYMEDLFSARVTLDYWVKGYNADPNYVKVHHVDVTFYYLKTDAGTWRMCDWELDGGVEVE